MSKYSEVIGSFIRTGDFPLEANLIFNSELELRDFYNEPLNRATLHKGLLKIVDDGTKQVLYWVIEKEGNLVFEPFKGGSELEQSITAMNVSVGNIKSGDTIPEGTTFTQFVLKMLVKPNAPTYSITSISGLGSPVEVGTKVNGATAVFTQNQGGTLTNVTANATGFLDKSTLSTSNDGKTVTISFTGRIAEGNNTVSSSINYAESALFPEIKAGSLTASKTIVGQRKIFMGNGIAPKDNTKIRTSKSILYSQSFSYNLDVNSTSMWIAVPSTRKLVEVKDAGALNAVITGNFVNSGSVLVDGASLGKDAVNYTIFLLSGYGPFGSAHTMNFKIN